MIFDDDFLRYKAFKSVHVYFQNAAGHNYSLCYGFGVLNAMDMINKAKDWKLVGDQLTREVRGQLTPETSKIPSNGILTLKVRNTYRDGGFFNLFSVLSC